MSNLIKVSIPLDTIHWANTVAETVWVEVDKRTYDISQSGKPGGFFHGILRNSSAFFPKSFCCGAEISFTLNYDGLPIAIITEVPNGFGQKVAIDEKD